ncbi:MAG TPA: hypothetical protein VHY83_11335 [Solirubrobacteraceae bacterium]|nr:hypothetical protein [Solirubrobacteraceae bacterium]
MAAHRRPHGHDPLRRRIAAARPSWSRVAAVIAGTGLTERDDAIFVIDLLRPDDLCVDVGANIGFLRFWRPVAEPV